MYCLVLIQLRDDFLLWFVSPGTMFCFIIRQLHILPMRLKLF